VDPSFVERAFQVQRIMVLAVSVLVRGIMILAVSVLVR
jgi:hypothetical protein